MMRAIKEIVVAAAVVMAGVRSFGAHAQSQGQSGGHASTGSEAAAA
mgnify:FL=1